MQLRSTLALIACAAALAGPAASAAPAAALPDAEADLLAAREAAHKGQFKALETWAARHPGHPLEPYPAFWMLSGQVSRVDPADVRAFLARYADTPLAEPLRRDWLKALAAAGAWEVFRSEHRSLATDDVEITCYALQDRLARGDADAAGEARVLFQAARDTHAACQPVFAALAADGRIATADIWGRLRKLLAANLVREAKKANALLPKREALAERTLDRAGADPSGYLAREKSALATRGAKEAVLFAIGRLARLKPDEAAERLAAFAARLGPEASRDAWAHLAWHAALNHHPRALEFYAEAGDAALTDTQLAWRARAALRAGEWRTVLASIQALSPEEAREPTWRYWRARALRQLGETAAADALLKGLAGATSFYGLLAAEELGVAPTPDWNGARPAEADLERMRAVPAVQRALALYRMGLDNEALREWSWALRGRGDRELLAASEIARLAGVHDRAISAADRTVQIHDFALRYPMPHREVLSAAAQHWGLDEALVYSIIRQESRFVPEARSPVGATGLMQLMPATARWVAKQIPVQPFRADMLVQPQVNAHMGSYYLRRVLDDLGHPILAAAAYNAGPGRARRWRDERPIEGAIYAETIPFNETRDYVKKVLANTWFYRHRLGGKPSLRELLGMVPGRGGEPAGFVANIP